TTCSGELSDSFAPKLRHIGVGVVVHEVTGSPVAVGVHQLQEAQSVGVLDSRSTTPRLDRGHRRQQQKDTNRCSGHRSVIDSEQWLSKRLSGKEGEYQLEGVKMRTDRNRAGHDKHSD